MNDNCFPTVAERPGMKLARIETDDGIHWGEYDDGTVITDDQAYEPSAYRLRAPCDPEAIYCVGRNFGEKVEQMDYDIPDEPDFFIKPPTAVCAPGEPIVYPSFTDKLTYAGELAAVIDTTCSNVSRSEVDSVVRGYTILNDLDALDQPRRTARKAFDGSAPIGPWLETEIDPDSIEMETHVDDERRQADSTENMFIDPRTIIEFLSERFTFTPGDVISFGSPANPGVLEPTNEVRIRYDGIGTLSNRVVAPEK